jgi:hypothetical protein
MLKHHAKYKLICSARCTHAFVRVDIIDGSRITVAAQSMQQHSSHGTLTQRCITLLSCRWPAGGRSDLQLLVQHPHGQDTFNVHRAVLQQRCPQLAQLADRDGPIVVTGMAPRVAEALLFTIYTGEAGVTISSGLLSAADGGSPRTAAALQKPPKRV